MFEKLIRDGKQAVVYSPGFGAGWSTWNRDHAERLATDRRIAEAVLADDAAGIKEAVRDIADEMYFGGMDGLEVTWVDCGSLFRVTEYDGFESVEVGPDDFWRAG